MKSAVFAERVEWWDEFWEAGMGHKVCKVQIYEDPSLVYFARLSVRFHSAAVLINLFYKMLILYLALKTRSFNCSTPSPYFSVHLSKFFFLVIICHPQGPCVHILDTWSSKFRKCTICTSVKRQVILLFFYQILKVSDHLFRLISLPDVYLGINYDFHSFNRVKY